jgi:glycogen(starch) synthase
MLTWEYPPRIIGGISRVVEGLSKALASLGVEVHVVTTDMPGTPLEQNDGNVRIHRVTVDAPAPNFHTWVLLMNHFFSKRVGRLAREVGGFDIVHVHDWLVLPSGAEVKSFLGCQMVSTLHSLEFKRAGGISSPEGQMIDSMEWWITYESGIVIVCSGSMKEDSKWKFKVPEDKIWVIPIGLDPKKFTDAKPQRDQVRARYGVGNGESIILYVGRLTHQKGCEFLIRAFPSVVKYNNAKLLIVGEGYQRGELEYIAGTTGESWRIKFLGFIPDSDVVDLMLTADVMVIPSVYEPFGVVALEAMAAGVPVVASDVDGLGEIIKHEYSGVLVHARDPSSISWGISKVLSDRNFAKKLVENGKKEVRERFAWSAVGELTLEAYKKALKL